MKQCAHHVVKFIKKKNGFNIFYFFHLTFLYLENGILDHMLLNGNYLFLRALLWDSKECTYFRNTLCTPGVTQPWYTMVSHYL